MREPELPSPYYPPLSPEETTTPRLYEVARALGMMLYKQQVYLSEMEAIGLAEAMDAAGLLKDSVPRPSFPDEQIYYLKDQDVYVAADGAGWLPGTFPTAEAARKAQRGSEGSVSDG